MVEMMDFLRYNVFCNIDGTCALHYALDERLCGKPRFEHICAVNHDIPVNYTL